MDHAGPSIENTVNPGTGAEDETASEVKNNVLSNFANIMKPDEAQEIELGLYTKDEEPVAYDFATIEMPFNKQAVSKKTLLENTQLLASLDGGKTLMTLDNVNKLLGSKISIGAYTVTPKYYTDASQSTEITDKTAIGKFILRVDNSKLVYDTKLATVDFRAAGVSGDVGKNVVCAHKIVINVDGEGHDGNDRGAADLHHHQPGRRNLHLQGDSQTAGMELCVRQERHRRPDRYPGDLR